MALEAQNRNLEKTLATHTDSRQVERSRAHLESNNKRIDALKISLTNTGEARLRQLSDHERALHAAAFVTNSGAGAIFKCEDRGLKCVRRGVRLAGRAFAAVMAFNKGGTVPGAGNGDTVPAMLTPQEYVADKALTAGLKRVAQDGNMGGGGQNVHVRPTYNLQALDGKGIKRTLQSHTGTLTKHFNQQVRRMNKG